MSLEAGLEREQIERRLLELRDPLARIELAASQLVRLQSGSADRALIRRIVEAVADLDGRLQESIGALAPRPGARAGAADCGAVLERVVRELAPVLGARARTLEPLVLPAVATWGDGRLARRAALQLLRVGGAWAGRGGRLRLELVLDEERCGVRVAATRAGPQRKGCEDPFGAARRFALAEGVELDVSVDEAATGCVAATLWVPSGASA